MMRVLGTIALCVCFVSVAQARPASPIEMTVAGEGKWSISCTLERPNGIIDREKLKPDNTGRAVLKRDSLGHGSCEYRLRDKPITVSVSGDSWACPFQVAAAGDCRATLAAGTAGTMQLRKRTGR